MARNRKNVGVKVAATVAAASVVALGLGACGASNTSSDSGTGTVPYLPGDKSSATSHPPNPVISKMSYRKVDGVTNLVVPISTVAGSDKDTATATLNVYADLKSQQRLPKPIYTISKPVELGDNKEALLPVPADVLAAVGKSKSPAASQGIVVNVAQSVDGDANGTPEGTVNAHANYQSSQVEPAGETVNLTIGTNVANVNIATIPVVCMYSGGFSALNTNLATEGNYVSSSIEADGDIFDSPQYGGPAWSEIVSELSGDAVVDIARAIAGALGPVNIAVQALIDALSLATENCDSQASIFQVLAASPTTGDTTSQAYVASEQTSNGLLSAATANSWQANMQAQGGTVWQETVSNKYLAQATAASVDNGLSIEATNQSVGDLTTSSTWTFMINQGGTSSIPNGCDDKGC